MKRISGKIGTRFTPAFYLFLLYLWILLATMHPHPSQLDLWTMQNAPRFLPR